MLIYTLFLTKPKLKISLISTHSNVSLSYFLFKNVIAAFFVSLLVLYTLFPMIAFAYDSDKVDSESLSDSRLGHVGVNATPGESCDRHTAIYELEIGTEKSIGICDPLPSFRFSHWESYPVDVEFADPTARETTFIVPYGGARITAVFVPKDNRVLIRETFSPHSATFCISPNAPSFIEPSKEVEMRLNLNRWGDCEYRFSHWSSTVFPRIPSSMGVVFADRITPVTTFIVPEVDSILITANFFHVESLAKRIAVGIIVDTDEVSPDRDDGLIPFTTATPQIARFYYQPVGYQFSQWESYPLHIGFQFEDKTAPETIFVGRPEAKLVAVFMPIEDNRVIVRHDIIPRSAERCFNSVSTSFVSPSTEIELSFDSFANCNYEYYFSYWSSDVDVTFEDETSPVTTFIVPEVEYITITANFVRVNADELQTESPNFLQTRSIMVVVGISGIVLVSVGVIAIKVKSKKK